MSEKPLAGAPVLPASDPAPPAAGPLLSASTRACMALVEAFSHDEPMAGRRALLILALRSAHEATHAPPTRRIMSEEMLESFLAECAHARKGRTD